MNRSELTSFRVLFAIAALWNLAGGILGYLNTGFAFELMFDRELTDPLFHGVYRGAWGTTMVYFVGYSIVAFNPLKHVGIVIVGGIGKVGFAVQLLQFYFAGLATAHAFVVIVGDFVFCLAFVVYFWRLLQSKAQLATRGDGQATAAGYGA